MNRPLQDPKEKTVPGESRHLSEAIQGVGGRAGVRSSALDINGRARIRVKRKTTEASVDSRDRLCPPPPASRTPPKRPLAGAEMCDARLSLLRLASLTPDSLPEWPCLKDEATFAG